MRVAGKTLVVTGGGDGIGREVVLELLRRGARVAAVDIRPEALATTEADAGRAADWPRSWSTSPTATPPGHCPGR